jgi:hypothetical protein
MKAKLKQLFIGPINKGGGHDSAQGTAEMLGFPKEI